MIDTIKIILQPKDLNHNWDIKEIQRRLDPYEKFHRWGFKPLGFIKSFCVHGNDRVLIIEGSLAKFFNGDNIQPFEFKYIKPAIKMLSGELGLKVERGMLSRIDIGGNLEMNEAVTDYFTELNYLRYYQRIQKRTTTLRFEQNMENVNIIFYDKLAEYKKKKISDPELTALAAKNLLRYELQIQRRISSLLKMKKVKAVHLYSPSFYEVLLSYWFAIYSMIEKKALIIFPQDLKGRKAVDRLIYRYFVEKLGWYEIESMFNHALKNGNLTSSDKSRKLNQLRQIMRDNTNFEFKNITKELNEKIEVIYNQGMSQIEKLK